MGCEGGSECMLLERFMDIFDGPHYRGSSVGCVSE
jgi:hypothetical protein